MAEFTFGQESKIKVAWAISPVDDTPDMLQKKRNSENTLQKIMFSLCNTCYTGLNLCPSGCCVGPD